MNWPKQLYPLQNIVEMNLGTTCNKGWKRAEDVELVDQETEWWDSLVGSLYLFCCRENEL